MENYGKETKEFTEEFKRKMKDDEKKSIKDFDTKIDTKELEKVLK